MLSDERKKANKNSLGSALKSARQEAGLTQKALAGALGLEYYTMVSQMELGYMSIPASLWAGIAIALKMDVARWVLRCLGEYQPDVYEAIFGKRSQAEAAAVIRLLHDGGLDSLIADEIKKNNRLN